MTAEDIKAELEILKAELELEERRINSGYYEGNTYGLNHAIMRIEFLKELLGEK